MTVSVLIAASASIVLVLASAASLAQDKPSSPTASKPITTLSKAARQASKPTTVQQDMMTKTVKQRTEAEKNPSATQSTPVSERSYDECHHAKDSDA